MDPYTHNGGRLGDEDMVEFADKLGFQYDDSLAHYFRTAQAAYAFLRDKGMIVIDLDGNGPEVMDDLYSYSPKRKRELYMLDRSDLPTSAPAGEMHNPLFCGTDQDVLQFLRRQRRANRLGMWTVYSVDDKDRAEGLSADEWLTEQESAA